MRLGLNFGYQDWGSQLHHAVAIAKEADSLGYYSGWTAEAYGTDAITPLTWLMAHTTKIKWGTAIMQMPARTPAMTAMTATTLDLMGDGRFLLGLGTSGPQVVEGWHGQRFGKPLVKTREYVSIVREILKREKPLVHHGEHYNIPYDGADATGLGKPLRLIVHPKNANLPIYLAAIGPKNVELAAELADGWLPVWYSPDKAEQVFRASLEAGFKKAGKDKGFENFDIAPSVTVLVGDDLESLRNFVKPILALYIGGMGAREKNFYNDLACRYGYEAAAKQIQDLYLGGKKDEAAAQVPDALVDEVSLIGTKERIKDNLQRYKSSWVKTLIVSSPQPEAFRVMAELAL